MEVTTSRAVPPAIFTPVRRRAQRHLGLARKSGPPPTPAASPGRYKPERSLIGMCGIPDCQARRGWSYEDRDRAGGVKRLGVGRRRASVPLGPAEPPRDPAFRPSGSTAVTGAPMRISARRAAWYRSIPGVQGVSSSNSGRCLDRPGVRPLVLSTRSRTPRASRSLSSRGGRPSARWRPGRAAPST
jgi:hypothetical protein